MNIILTMKDVPAYIGVAFALTTALSVFYLLKADKYRKITVVILALWLLAQGLVAGTGFYTVTNTLPPRFLLLVLPPVLFILTLFSTRKGRQYIDGLDAGSLTMLHVVRVPVELVLFGLFVHGAIPEIMTFEGRNPDILSGITAPFVFYFGYVRKKMGRWALLVWNLLCLALLINIVRIAILSVPTPFQQFGFDHPNIAVMHFPFVWLPCCVVPLVLFSHVVSIRKVLMRNSS